MPSDFKDRDFKNDKCIIHPNSGHCTADCNAIAMAAGMCGDLLFKGGCKKQCKFKHDFDYKDNPEKIKQLVTKTLDRVNGLPHKDKKDSDRYLESNSNDDLKDQSLTTTKTAMTTFTATSLAAATNEPPAIATITEADFMEPSDSEDEEELQFAQFGDNICMAAIRADHNRAGWLQFGVKK